MVKWSSSKVRVVLGLICLVAAMTYAVNYFVIGRGFGMRQIGMDTPQAVELKEVVQRAENVLGEAAASRNLDLMDTAFVNHPAFAMQLNGEQRARLKQNIHRFLGPDAKFGYLNAMKAKRMLQWNGERLGQVAVEKAQAAGRQVTREEWLALQEQNYGYPASTPPSDSNEKSYPRYFEFYSIKVGFDRAVVGYSAGIKGVYAILVRIDGRWMVASILH